MNDSDVKYLLEEFRALKSEIGAAVEMLAVNLRYAVLGSFAVITWLLKAETGTADKVGYIVEYVKYAWFVPFAITFLLATFSAALASRIAKISDYLQILEHEFVRVGWEHYYSLRRPLSGAFYTFSWGALIAVDLAIGLVGSEIINREWLLTAAITSAFAVAFLGLGCLAFGLMTRAPLSPGGRALGQERWRRVPTSCATNPDHRPGRATSG